MVFLDLPGFTAFAETNDPEDVMRVLGDCHAAMGGLVMRQGATLERFAGDGMMIFLNDPMPVDRPARNAVAALVNGRAAGLAAAHGRSAPGQGSS